MDRLFHSLILLVFWAVFCLTQPYAFAETLVRVATANTTTGDRQSYDPGEGIRIFQGTKPDIVMIQEFNFGDNSSAAIRQFVDSAFGSGFHYFREQGRNYNIPNGIISRYPIEDSGSFGVPTLADRGISWAKIRLPGNQILWAYSAHFSHSSSESRAQEADALISHMSTLVGTSDFVVLGGDLNTKTRVEPALAILGRKLSDAYIPNSPDGGQGTNASSVHSHPYDLVLPNPLLDGLHACTNLMGRVGQRPATSDSVFPGGVIIDTRRFQDLSHLAPIRAGDSGAPGMQHHMVMKTFSIP